MSLKQWIIHAEAKAAENELTCACALLTVYTAD